MLLNFTFDIHSHTWGPDEVVANLDSLDEAIRSQVEEQLNLWRPLRGARRPRSWFQAMGGHSRSKNILLEKAGILRGFVDPETGRWEGAVDDHFRMTIRKAILSVSAERPSRDTSGLKHYKPKRTPRPRTEGELRALAQANEKRRLEAKRRREAEATS